MHDTTKKEIIEGATTIAGTLLKESLVFRKDKEILREKMDHELELERLKNERLAPDTAKRHPTEYSTGTTPTEDTTALSLDGEPESDDGITAHGHPGGHQQSPGQQSRPDVYDHIRSLRGEVTCGFCKEMLTQLEDQPPEVARKGFDEIRTFEQEKRRLLESDVPAEKAEERLMDMASTWEVVPELLTGGDPAAAVET